MLLIIICVFNAKGGWEDLDGRETSQIPPPWCYCFPKTEHRLQYSLMVMMGALPAFASFIPELWYIQLGPIIYLQRLEVWRLAPFNALTSLPQR